MELRWTEEAAADLEHITDYLFQNAPERAAELVRGIYDAPAALPTFPYRGRACKKERTRELVLSSLQYIVVYQVANRTQAIARHVPGRFQPSPASFEGVQAGLYPGEKESGHRRKLGGDERE